MSRGPSRLAPKFSRYEQKEPCLELAVSKWESLLHLAGPDLIAPARQNEMFRVSDTIRRTGTADGGVLLDVQRGQMFCLNVVGAKILELIQQGYDESRIADQISRDFGAPKDVVRADVIEFIETLQKHHVLQPVRSANVT